VTSDLGPQLARQRVRLVIEPFGFGARSLVHDRHRWVVLAGTTMPQSGQRIGLVQNSTHDATDGLEA
jgi:hypothetical protein